MIEQRKKIIQHDNICHLTLNCTYSKYKNMCMKHLGFQVKFTNNVNLFWVIMCDTVIYRLPLFVFLVEAWYEL